MGKEVERKFLVSGDEWRRNAIGKHCRQAYLSVNPACSVRVRRIGDRAYLTVKGLTTGITRPEYEYEIPVADAESMLDTLYTSGLIEKYRYTIEFGGNVWVIDEFLGANKGLVVAEIELEHENAAFEKPAWIGKEVSHDHRYRNLQLAAFPYSAWDE